MWHDVGFRVVIWWILRRWSLHSRGRIWRFGAIFGECFGDVTRSTPVAPSSPSTSPEACGVTCWTPRLLEFHCADQARDHAHHSDLWQLPVKELKAGTHETRNSKGYEVMKFLKDVEGPRFKKQRDNRRGRGRGCQWVPSIGVGYNWTRKGSRRMQFRQLWWLTENTRRAWLHWGRIYVVWPRRPSWSCFWKSFWAAL